MKMSNCCIILESFDKMRSHFLLSARSSFSPYLVACCIRNLHLRLCISIVPNLCGIRGEPREKILTIFVTIMVRTGEVVIKLGPLTQLKIVVFLLRFKYSVKYSKEHDGSLLANVIR